MKKSIGCFFAYFFISFFPIILIVLSIMFGFYKAEISRYRFTLEMLEKTQMEHKKEDMLDDLEHVAFNLACLSDLSSLRSFVDDPSDSNKKDLIEDFFVFCAVEKKYDQIRFIDDKGLEIVRINYNKGNTEVVSPDKLQYKTKRYYFRDTYQLSKDQVFVSPLDLNIERGEIEKPLKPMIRFGKPIFTKDNVKKGVIILNFLAEGIIKRFSEHHSKHGLLTNHSLMVNHQGFWLKGFDSSDEWGFMFQNNKKFEHYSADAWQIISSKDFGQFENDKGLFTFDTIYPIAEAQVSSTGSVHPFEESKAKLFSQGYFWKIINHIEREDLYSKNIDLLARIRLFFIMFFILWFMTSLFIAFLLQKRKEKAEELKEYAQQLQETNAMKDKLLSIISHDLRNPLSVITGMSTALIRDFADGFYDDAKSFCHDINVAGQRALTLLQNLMQWAQIQTGSLRCHPESIELRSLVDFNIDLLKTNSADKSITVVNDVAAEIMGLGDRNMIDVVLRNLINNAIKFTPENGSVTVTAKDNGQEISVSVTDTGVGIAQEKIETLYKLDKDCVSTPGTNGERGSGLGLILCKDFIKKNGGQIFVESEISKGTTFTFTLPKACINGK